MDKEDTTVSAETQQVLREILTFRQELRKLEFAYDEVQKAALNQLEAEWKEACSDFLDVDRLLQRTMQFALTDRRS